MPFAKENVKISGAQIFANLRSKMEYANVANKECVLPRELDSSNPKEVWTQFRAISQIPRCSGNEAAVIQYLRELAQAANAEHDVDSVGNLLVRLPAAPGFEEREGVVLQGHVDMVCEKNRTSKHDFARDPIQLCVEEDTLRADNTTLGADNGIAVAYMAALIRGRERTGEDQPRISFTHGPLELLFTVDEETGLTGATNLDPSLLQFRRLINLDSEDEGHFCIGCAGGRETTAFLGITLADLTPDADKQLFEVFVAGLRGGHSGVEIHLELGNALTILARVLDSLGQTLSLDIVGLEGGDKHNAIPREASAKIIVSSKEEAKLRAALQELATSIASDLGPLDSNFKLSLTQLSGKQQGFAVQQGRQLVQLMRTLPNGVQSLSRVTPGLVSSSSNLAAVKLEGTQLQVLTSQRCESEVRLDDLSARITAVCKLNGFTVQASKGYPGWLPNADSKLLAASRKLYKKRYGREAHVEIIHAGLECGVIGKRIPGMDMISFGPDIRGAHTPDETVSISSTERVWEFLLNLLEELP